MGSNDKRRLTLAAWTVAYWAIYALDRVLYGLAKAFNYAANRTFLWRTAVRIRLDAARAVEQANDG